MAVCPAANGAVLPGGHQHAAASPGVRQHAAVGGHPVEIWNADELETVRTLGEGGFGVVVLARRRDSGELIAVKSHRPSASADKTYDDDAAAAAVIRAEAGFLAACRGHPSVVALKAVVVHPLSGELSGLAMEYVGPSLHDVISKQRNGEPVPETAVRGIMRQLLSAAKHMHGRHVVHRDIKPRNVLMGEEDDYKICDLGLAMSLDASPSEHPGTVPYMAPEMLLGRPDCDGMVDMWALGCVMAELLLGKPLFDGTTARDALCSIFRLLGAPTAASWPGYASLPFARYVAPPPGCRDRSLLREVFPKACLSEEGFNVLSGLLSCNPDKRLSATVALRRPWFST